MVKDLENYNKKIATFIVASISLAIPVAAATQQIQQTKGVIMQDKNILRYAGPYSNIETTKIKKETVKFEEPMVRYAGPQKITVEVKQDENTIQQDKPIVRYAGPQMTQNETVELEIDDSKTNSDEYKIDARHYIPKQD